MPTYNVKIVWETDVVAADEAEAQSKAEAEFFGGPKLDEMDTQVEEILSYEDDEVTE